jgi:hypothetical protein
MTLGYKLLAPYSDEDDTTFAHNTLCPRYAENDLTSAPPSPASIQSFDVLDSIPWRRSYISLGNETDSSKRSKRWKKQRARAIVLLLLFTLLSLGCGVGVYMAIKHGNKKQDLT